MRVLPSMKVGLASCSGNQVDQLPGSPDEAKADESSADSGLGHLHCPLVVADHAEVHEAGGSQRHSRDQPRDFDARVQQCCEKRRDPADIHWQPPYASESPTLGRWEWK